MSLVEMLVAAGVAVVGFTLASNVLVPAMQTHVREARRVDAQRHITSLLSWLGQDLRRSSAAALKIGDDGLSLPQLLEVSADGAGCWENGGILYVRSGERVQRAQIHLSDGASQTPVCPDFDAPGPRRTIASNVRFLRFAKTQTGVQVEVGVDVAGYRAQAVQSFRPRCQW